MAALTGLDFGKQRLCPQERLQPFGGVVRPIAVADALVHPPMCPQIGVITPGLRQLWVQHRKPAPAFGLVTLQVGLYCRFQFRIQDVVVQGAMVLPHQGQLA